MSSSSARSAFPSGAGFEIGIELVAKATAGTASSRRSANHLARATTKACQTSRSLAGFRTTFVGGGLPSGLASLSR